MAHGDQTRALSLCGRTHVRSTSALVLAIALLSVTPVVMAQTPPSPDAEGRPGGARVVHLLQASGYPYTKETPWLWSVPFSGTHRPLVSVWVITNDEEVIVESVIARHEQVSHVPEMMRALLIQNGAREGLALLIDEDGRYVARSRLAVEDLEVSTFRSSLRAIVAATEAAYVAIHGFAAAETALWTGLRERRFARHRERPRTWISCTARRRCHSTRRSEGGTIRRCGQAVLSTHRPEAGSPWSSRSASRFRLRNCATERSPTCDRPPVRFWSWTSNGDVSMGPNFCCCKQTSPSEPSRSPISGTTMEGRGGRAGGHVRRARNIPRLPPSVRRVLERISRRAVSVPSSKLPLACAFRPRVCNAMSRPIHSQRIGGGTDARDRDSVNGGGLAFDRVDYENRKATILAVGPWRCGSVHRMAVQKRCGAH
jgi:hypothetical protein